MNLTTENWFQQIFNINEHEWDYKLDSLPNYYYNNYKFGKFYTESINSLSSKLNKLNTNNDTTFEILINKSKDLYKLDTSYLQYNCNDKLKPIFQIASNFNCLELSNEHVNPFNGNFITHSMTESTQGPNAVCGAPYGLLNKIAYHYESEINLLDNLEKINVINGKCYYKDNKKYENEINYNDIKIGILENTYSIIDRSDITRIKYNPKGKCITQIHSATCINYNYNYNILSDKFLQAAYEGIFLYACLNNNKEIYLTLIGGQSFKNNKDCIMKNIINAYYKYKLFLPHNCKVILPFYSHIDDKIIKKYFNNDNFIIKYIE